MLKNRIVDRDPQTGAPVSMRCDCGARIDLDGCDVECGCGAKYNAIGQRLAAGGREETHE